MRGWRVELEDGRVFAWDEQDGIRSADEARLRMASQEPEAMIRAIEEEKIVLVVELGMN